MNQHQPIPPPQHPVGPPGMGRPGPMGLSGPGLYPPQPPRPVRRRVWPWITGGVLVLAVVAGAGVVVGYMAQSEISSSPTVTHTYPERFPKQKLPAQIDGYKRDLNGPAVYQILRPSRTNPNVVDISRSERIGIADEGICEGGSPRPSRRTAGESHRSDPGVFL